MGPIGVFDSGYGGLTVLKELTKKLPQYDFLYIGDNARAPYGTRSFETVYHYTLQAVKRFFDLGCHLVILACNTASAKALRSIQQKDLPRIAPERRVLGIIRPSVEAISDYTQNNHVGVLGTIGTVNSQSYVLELEKMNPDINVVQEACPMWVPLVENHELDSVGTDYFVKQHINSILKKAPELDTLILGCTHYPLLVPVIQKFLPDSVRLLSQGEVVAPSLEDYLNRHPEIDKMCTKGGSVQYYTTEVPKIFEERAQVFCGAELMAEHIEIDLI